MHKTAQAWFSGPSASANDLPAQTPSLLADWNAYAASSRAAEEEEDAALGFDIESAVRSANDKVSGTFNVYVLGEFYSFIESKITLSRIQLFIEFRNTMFMFICTIY